MAITKVEKTIWVIIAVLFILLICLVIFTARAFKQAKPEIEKYFQREVQTSGTLHKKV